VPSYLAERGHTRTRIETVVAYVQRQRQRQRPTERAGPTMRLLP
jgi:hypothetical protein